MRKWLAAAVAVAVTATVAAPALAQSVPERVYTPPPVCAPGSRDQRCRPADVPADHYAVQAIATVVQAGIMVGDPTGAFRPEARLTVAEATTVMLRVLGLNPAAAKEGHWATPILAQAVQMGLLDSGLTQNPDQPITRAQVAVMVAKALGLQPATTAPLPWSDVSGLDATTRGYLAALYRAGYFKGYPDGTFRPDQTLTRAEMAVLVSRILATQGR